MANGNQHWYKNKKGHREDGPAIISADGTKSWFINGEEVQPPSKFTINTQFNIKDGF